MEEIEGEIVVAQVAEGVGEVGVVAREVQLPDFVALFVVFQCYVHFSLKIQHIAKVIESIPHLQMPCRQRQFIPFLR